MIVLSITIACLNLKIVYYVTIKYFILIFLCEKHIESIVPQLAVFLFIINIFL